MKFDFKHWNDIDRLDIVGEAKRQRQMAIFRRPLPFATIRLFDRARLDVANSRLERQPRQLAVFGLRPGTLR